MDKKSTTKNHTKEFRQRLKELVKLLDKFDYSITSFIFLFTIHLKHKKKKKVNTATGKSQNTKAQSKSFSLCRI